MNSDEYIALAMRTAIPQSQKEMITESALGLAGEAGEIADAVKKWRFQGHKLNTIDLYEELGDVLWYIALMCSATGTNFERLWEMNIEKISKRYPNGFDENRSINREDL